MQGVRRRGFGTRRTRWLVIGLSGILALVIGGTALAAEIAGGEFYRLPAGQVVGDDLYVTGQEIIIDGEVQGDVVAAGGYIEINGVVTGDLIAAGGGIRLNGEVQDDVRVAAGGVTVAGRVGDDLFVAGGGGTGFLTFPIRVGDRTISQGVTIEGRAQIGGDAYVVGGQGVVAGAIGGDLVSGMQRLSFAGQVDGNADLYAESLTVAPVSKVGGTLRYGSSQPVTVPPGVAATVQAIPVTQAAEEVEEPATAVLMRFLGWLLRTVLILAGLALLAWLLVRFAPALLEQPVRAIEAKPMEAAIIGIVAVAAIVPLSAALVFLAVLFFGWFPGGVLMFLFLFGLFGLAWILSPLLTGLWLGRWLLGRGGGTATLMASVVLGALIIALLGRFLGLIPCLGELAYRLVYVISLALAIGGVIQACRASHRAAEPTAVASYDI